MSDKPVMSDADHLNYIQLKSLFVELDDTPPEDDPIHDSHAVEKFVHAYFHMVVEASMHEQVMANEPIDLEALMRACMSTMLEFGYEFGRRGFILNPCQCGEMTDDKIKELFPIEGHHHDGE